MRINTYITSIIDIVCAVTTVNNFMCTLKLFQNIKGSIFSDVTFYVSYRCMYMSIISEDSDSANNGTPASVRLRFP